MKRRDFLKLCGMTAVAPSVLASIPKQPSLVRKYAEPIGTGPPSVVTLRYDPVLEIWLWTTYRASENREYTECGYTVGYMPSVEFLGVNSTDYTMDHHFVRGMPLTTWTHKSCNMSHV